MRSLKTRDAAGALASGVLALTLALAGATTGGCELAVPDTIPAFTCEPGQPDVCPSDAVCAPATRQCIALSLACTTQGCPPGFACNPDTLFCDAGTVDGGSFATCHSLGCPCSGPSDCTSGICADQLTVGSSVYDAASQASFCTKPCCTSADCDGSTACFATAAGASFCVRPEWLGRTKTLGTGSGGATCSNDSDCRSGLCAGASCADTCCSTANSQTECSPGGTCGFGTFPGRSFDTHYTAYCSPTLGAGVNGSVCASNSQCLGGLCVAQACHDACRNSADCGSSAQECGYAIATSAIVTACSASPGTGAEGSSCQGNGECQSGFCDAASKQCTDVCFANSDCTVDGWRCRPEVAVLGGASFSFLACGS